MHEYLLLGNAVLHRLLDDSSMQATRYFVAVVINSI